MSADAAGLLRDAEWHIDEEVQTLFKQKVTGNDVVGLVLYAGKPAGRAEGAEGIKHPPRKFPGFTRRFRQNCLKS